MDGLIMNVNLDTVNRTGIYTPSESTCKYHSLEADKTYPVRILGLLADEGSPCFICELQTGRVINVYSEYVILDPKEDDTFRMGDILHGAEK